MVNAHAVGIGYYSPQTPWSLLTLQANRLLKTQCFAAIIYRSTPPQLSNSQFAMENSSSVEKGAYVQDSTVSSPGSTAEVTFDPAAERKLLRKLDLRILPVLWILYLVNFIDR